MWMLQLTGGINVDNSQKLIEAGADILVAGTAIISSKDYAQTIRNLR